MYVIKRSFEQSLSLPNESKMRLPASYKRFLENQNGGYATHPFIPTKEPTSDGLDYAFLHYFLGDHDTAPYAIQDYQREELPLYLVVFSANADQLFVFDYQHVPEEGEPSIRYLDLETDNWQLVAPSFDAFLAMSERFPFREPHPEEFRLFEAEHAFLLAQNAETFRALFTRYESYANKVWYFEWLQYAAALPDETVQEAVFDALEIQLLYFRLTVPPAADSLLQLFEAHPTFRERAIALRKEWMSA